MSFWDLEDGDLEATGSFETGGGDIEPIPAKTQVLASIDEAKFDEYQGDKYISIRWNVLKPEEYKNRKIFHKVRVFDTDTKKRDKAKRMLAAIDANAGGKLLSSGEAPTDQSLTQCLVNKQMLILLQVWEIEDEQTGDIKKGNWVSAVAPKGAAQSAQPSAVPPQSQQSKDDDIPW